MIRLSSSISKTLMQLMISMLFLMPVLQQTPQMMRLRLALTSQSFYGRLPNATVADIHAIGHDGSSAATATCIVCAALLDDVA